MQRKQLLVLVFSVLCCSTSTIFCMTHEKYIVRQNLMYLHENKAITTDEYIALEKKKL